MGNVVIGLYKRKFFFFLALGLIVVGAFIYLQNQSSQASLLQDTVGNQENVQSIRLDVEKNGQVVIAGKQLNSLVKHYQDYDQLKLVAYDAAGYYISQLEIVVNLPESVADGAVKQGVYAVHGVGSYKFSQQDDKTLLYYGYDISPTATFTITADLPNGVIIFPWYKKIVFALESLPFEAWVGLSVIFPLLTIAVLLWMMFCSIKKWRVRPKEILAQLPESLAPAVVGVLVGGKVSGRLIAATIMDLARRGYLEIFQKNGTFLFIKRTSREGTDTSKDGLRSFEKMLMSKIFSPTSTTSTSEDIQIRLGQHIFSRKVAEIYLSLYDEVTARGFFYQNPSQFHHKYYIFGLILFFLGLIGFIFGIFFAPEPKFLLLVWFGMIMSAMLIIKLIPHLPGKTAAGEKETIAWLKFKNFLSGDKPISFYKNSQEIFEYYLPYAIALGVEDQWATRFMNVPFQQPGWFTSTSTTFILEDFVANLFPLISFISQALVRAHEPVVE